MAAILVVAGCRAGQPQDGYEAIVSAAVSDLGAEIEAFGATLRSLNAVTGGGGVVALQASRASAKDAAAKVFQVRRSVGALDVPQDAEAFHDLVIQSMDAATQGFHAFQNCLFALDGGSDASPCGQTVDLFSQVSGLLGQAEREAAVVFGGA